MKSHSYPSHQGRPARNDLAPRRQPGSRTDGPRTGRHGRSGVAAALAHGGPASRSCRMSRRTLGLADLKLAQIEDAFLDLLLDAHPRRDTALDRLMNDLASAEPADAAAIAASALPAPDSEVAASSARRIESALLGAVIQCHPRRDRALDRLLCDLGVAATAESDSSAAPAAAHGAWIDKDERERAAFDLCCDNDYDGLG